MGASINYCNRLTPVVGLGVCYDIQKSIHCVMYLTSSLALCSHGSMSFDTDTIVLKIEYSKCV